VAGYSKLIGQYEAGTFAAVRRLRSEVIEPWLFEHKGRLCEGIEVGSLASCRSFLIWL
jgi:hypothetical protein